MTTARAGIHGGDQHDAGGIGDAGKRPGDGNPAVFHRLAQDFQDVLLELELGSLNNIGHLSNNPLEAFRMEIQKKEIAPRVESHPGAFLFYQRYRKKEQGNGRRVASPFLPYCQPAQLSETKVMVDWIE